MADSSTRYNHVLLKNSIFSLEIKRAIRNLERSGFNTIRIYQHIWKAESSFYFFGGRIKLCYR